MNQNLRARSRPLEGSMYASAEGRSDDTVIVEGHERWQQGTYIAVNHSRESKTKPQAGRQNNGYWTGIWRRATAVASYAHCDLSQAGSCKNAQRTLLPVYGVLFVSRIDKGRRTARTCSRGCPATIVKKRSKPSRLASMTSSEKRLVKTLPGKGGIFTRVDSRSRMSRNASKSEYRLRTTE